MRLFNTLLVLAGGAMLLAPAGVRADTPGHHPHYIHARGDLKEALFILQGPAEPNVAANFRAAAGEIQAAIRELNRAAYADAKDVYSRAHPDSHPDRVGRFRNIEKLISRARRDLGAEEDNPAALAWRDGAFRHIDAALGFVHRAARDAHLDHELGW
jgi:hypothetical protein